MPTNEWETAQATDPLSGWLAEFHPLYNLHMNKRAKKRLKESIAKDKQERAKSRPQERPGASKDPQQQRGFLPKPEKKRG